MQVDRNIVMVPQPPEPQAEYVLRLDAEEAKLLKLLVGGISGHTPGSLRLADRVQEKAPAVRDGLTNRIWNGLDRLGVKDHAGL